jgi:hypothetical protein
MNVEHLARTRVRIVALCLLALCALALPASAVAAGGHHAGSAHKAKAKGKGKKKKPKKKPAAPVIVKCASVGVTCKGTPGATGPQGPAGINGANGSAIVGRIRSTGPIAAGTETLPVGCESFSCIEGANIPLNPSTWTQGPTEDDQLIGSISIFLPSKTACAAPEDSSTKEPEAPLVFVIASVDGVLQGVTGTTSETGGVTLTSSIFGPSIFRFEAEEEGGSEIGSGFLLGSGASQAHAVTVKAFDNCKTTHATISKVAIDVLAAV